MHRRKKLQPIRAPQILKEYSVLNKQSLTSFFHKEKNTKEISYCKLDYDTYS